VAGLSLVLAKVETGVWAPAGGAEFLQDRLRDSPRGQYAGGRFRRG